MKRFFSIMVLTLGLLSCTNQHVSPFQGYGQAIAYSGYRLGQSPKSGVLPTREQIEEDLRILEKNWRLIRVYASDQHGEDILETIRESGLDFKVMLGVWLKREPGGEADNAASVREGIRLAKKYREIVVAVNVGNEILIEWTQHPVPEERVIGYVREVRDAIDQPVTVADNYVWWRDFGADLAREVDFITMHTYPLWERRDIEEGLSFTIENYEQVRQAHPQKLIVIGEAGWATYTVGNLHVPRGGDEAKQQRYFNELTSWADENGVTVFYFEAFDEPWKPAGTESHWGLFTADRRAKPVMQELYPELMPDGPTSPDYPDTIGIEGPDIRELVAEDSTVALEGSVNPLGPGLGEVGIEPTDDGEMALRMELNGQSWSGVYFMISPVDVTEATMLSMRVRLPEETSEVELKVESVDTQHASVNLMDYETGRRDGWIEVAVPWEALAGIDRSQLTTIGLWNPSNGRGLFIDGELWLDHLRIEH